MIREALKGHHQDDQEISKELMYWFFAHNFGFTPKQVDEMPYDRTFYFAELEKEIIKQEKQNGR